MREACARKNVSSETVAEQLEAELKGPTSNAENPATLPPADLINHIVKEHHEFLREELPRLRAMALRVARVHGGHTPSLLEVLDVFVAMEEELTQHLLKEEQILFPAIIALVHGNPSFASLEHPISCMIHEHEETGDALTRLRALTNGFTPPPDACNTYRALFDGLHNLEENLHQHIHLENAVLFPVARALFSAS